MVNIVLIEGDSGVGKTTLVEYLAFKYPFKYYVVNSYTDRPARKVDEKGHTFVSKEFMNKILKSKEIVAKTKYGKYRYCSTLNQFNFSNLVYNLYIVDKKGIGDFYLYRDRHPKKEMRITTIKILRDNVDIDEDRKNRKQLDAKIDIIFDLMVYNNGTVHEAAEIINDFLK